MLQLVYNISFLTCLLHPRKCGPSFLNNISSSPLPFQGSINRLEKKYHILATNAQCTREQFPKTFSPGENPHGAENPLFDRKTIVTIHKTHLQYFFCREGNIHIFPNGPTHSTHEK
jgi:hypothetical protein